ncbi:PPE domain-containing protein, partial [Mycobacterium avium]
GAYGLALAAVVAPHVIAANRLRRISLAEANCLGQLSPAVADADADYERMWAQDAAAMYAYARASAGVWKLTPFDSPPPAADPAPAGVTSPSRNWALTAAPEVITTGRQVISTISDALGALSVSPLATFDTSLLSATGALSRLSSLSAPLDFALNHLSALNKAAALGRAAVMCSPRPGGGGGTNSAALRVSVGRGAAIGILSVPRAWTRSVPSPASPNSPAAPLDRSQ